MIFSNKNGANTPFLLPYREGIEMKRLNELEEIIGYSFKNQALLELAMTHSSYSNDNKLGKQKNNERLDDLQCNGLYIIQDPNKYCFTSDAVALANFAKVKSGGSVVDLCSGSGVIGILIGAKNKVNSL